MTAVSISQMTCQQLQDAMDSMDGSWFESAYYFEYTNRTTRFRQMISAALTLPENATDIERADYMYFKLKDDDSRIYWTTKVVKWADMLERYRIEHNNAITKRDKKDIMYQIKGVMAELEYAEALVASRTHW